MTKTTFLRAVSMILVLAAGALAGADDGDSSYVAVEGWPQLPEGSSFGEVAGMGVDSHNHVFVFHRGADHPIVAFEGTSGKFSHSFGEGLFKNAHGLQIDSEDNVWITDNGHHTVMKFSHDGKLLLTVGEKDVTGWDATHFNQPTDVMVAPNGEFYVTDGYVNIRVAKFGPDGKFLMEWGKKGKGPGEFNLPHGIAQDAQGRIYVADRSNFRIQVFDEAGKFLHQWGTGQMTADGRPWGLEIAPNGNLYVIDGGNMNSNTPDFAQIVVLNLDGKVLDRWSSYGTKPGQLSWGHDVAVGKDGAVYTAEVRNNNRAQKFVKK